jgi:rod shape-determining protein MreD
VSPARLGVVVVGALTLQVTFFARFSFDGARPDVMVLLAVLGGYLLGAERGAIVGFAAGLAFDLLLTTPLGLSALVYALAGYASGTATATMVRASRWVPIAVAAIGSAAAMVVYAMVGACSGRRPSPAPRSPLSSASWRSSTRCSPRSPCVRSAGLAPTTPTGVNTTSFDEHR